MPRTRQRGPLQHPDPSSFDLLDILHALSDPTRIGIVRTLLREPEKACGTFQVDVAPSTLTHHFKVLRESGLIHQRDEDQRRLTTLRLNDLEQRFPGLLGGILRHASAPPTPDQNGPRTSGE